MGSEKRELENEKIVSGKREGGRGKGEGVRWNWE